jgi:hypothetical protein
LVDGHGVDCEIMQVRWRACHFAWSLKHAASVRTFDHVVSYPAQCK